MLYVLDIIYILIFFFNIAHLEDVPYYTTEQITPAMEYVSKIKRRFEGNEEGYQEFLDILNTYQRSPVDQVRCASFFNPKLYKTDDI